MKFKFDQENILEFKTLQFPSMKIYFILECMYQIYTNADQNFANLQKSIKSLEYFTKKSITRVGLDFATIQNGI